MKKKDESKMHITNWKKLVRKGYVFIISIIWCCVYGEAIKTAKRLVVTKGLVGWKEGWVSEKHRGISGW